MKRCDTDLDRLLRSAAKAGEAPAEEAPFGFETRVISLWRAGQAPRDDVADLTRFLRRTGVIALAVLALASTAAYQQFRDNAERAFPQDNEYAIADSEIQTEFSE
ncbi:MAG TPA: hypothetical protein VGW39_10305 [Chthoniobacterales bacterium]|nr:hypothetical protein [Chthoniobacterales bacterium]